MYELAKLIPTSDAHYRQEQDDGTAILESQRFLERRGEEGEFVVLEGERVVATIRVYVEAITKVMPVEPVICVDPGDPVAPKPNRRRAV